MNKCDEAKIGNCSHLSGCLLMLFVENIRSLYSQVSTRETRKVKHADLSLQRKGVFTCFPPRMLGMGVLYNLVIFLLSVGPCFT